MFWATGICSDVRQVDLSLLRGRHLNLGLLSSLLETLHGKRILTDIHPALLLEFAGQVINDPKIKVLPAEEGVTIGG